MQGISNLHLTVTGICGTARHTESAFDSDRDVWDCILHSLTALGNQLGLKHHGCTKATGACHPLTRAAAIEVDLIVAIPCNYLGSCCQGLGIATAQLTHNRVLFWREPEESARQ